MRAAEVAPSRDKTDDENIIASDENERRSMTRENRDDRLILLTGATGYVGGRLLRVLEHQGHRVRCLARRPEFLKPKVGAGTEIVAGDVLVVGFGKP